MPCGTDFISNQKMVAYYHIIFATILPIGISLHESHYCSSQNCQIVEIEDYSSLLALYMAPSSSELELELVTKTTNLSLVISHEGLFDFYYCSCCSCLLLIWPESLQGNYFKDV